MSPEQLRIIPNNGTVRELNIPKETLEMLEKFVASPDKTDANKKYMIKKFTKASPCCICAMESLLTRLVIPFLKAVQQGLSGIARSAFQGYILEMLYSNANIDPASYQT